MFEDRNKLLITSQASERETQGKVVLLQKLAVNKRKVE